MIFYNFVSHNDRNDREKLFFLINLALITSFVDAFGVFTALLYNTLLTTPRGIVKKSEKDQLYIIECIHFIY